MGNLPSHERSYEYYDITRAALRATRRLEPSVRGPRSRGAIAAYVDGRLDAQTMIYECTPLESNEFARLELMVHQRWCLDHRHLMPCVRLINGYCDYPDEYIHRRQCGWRARLPRGVELSDSTSTQQRQRREARAGGRPIWASNAEIEAQAAWEMAEDLFEDGLSDGEFAEHLSRQMGDMHLGSRPGARLMTRAVSPPRFDGPTGAGAANGGPRGVGIRGRGGAAAGGGISRGGAAAARGGLTRGEASAGPTRGGASAGGTGRGGPTASRGGPSATRGGGALVVRAPRATPGISAEDVQSPAGASDKVPAIEAAEGNAAPPTDNAAARENAPRARRQRPETSAEGLEAEPADF